MKSDLDEAFIGTCENCKRENVTVRRVKAIGMFNEPRGYFDICFECQRPEIYWTTKDGRQMHTPVTDEAVAELRKKGKIT